KVTVWVDQSAGAIGPYVVRLLDQLGYRTSLKKAHNPPFPEQLSDSTNRVQIGWFGWLQDYPTPSDFVDVLLSCRAFKAHDVDNFNGAEFCNRAIDGQMRRAYSLQTAEPATAGALWSRIDDEIVDRAPWVPLYNPRSLTALSDRVGNYTFHPFYLVLLDQLWVR